MSGMARAGRVGAAVGVFASFCLVAATPLVSPSTRGVGGWHARAERLAGRSIYFLVVDRFARTRDDGRPCRQEEREWCGGSIRGVTEHLDYIQGMGFDCVWVTPVVQQADDWPNACSGAAYHGYWAKDLYAVDPRFGTSADLKELSAELHMRGMCLIMDVVVNHMGQVNTTAKAEAMSPFNRKSHYHALDIGNRTFEEYVQQIPATHNGNCSNYTPVYGPVQALGPEATGVDAQHRLGCQVGDYHCQGYNETRITEGWFFELADLNQTVPFVRQATKEWLTWMVRTYKVDAIRLDTAPYVGFDFLGELQEIAGVPIMGEVTTNNMSFHARFVFDAEQGRRTLDGALNFPVANVAMVAFCNDSSSLPPELSTAAFNLNALGESMAWQASSGWYPNLDTLGNFVDNHDLVPRIRHRCLDDESRIYNALAWVMFARGAPVVYYGTEQGLSCSQECREPLWASSFGVNTPLYRFFRVANRLRRRYGLADASMVVAHADARRLVLVRRGKTSLGRRTVYVFLNNFASCAVGSEGVFYPVQPEPMASGLKWADALANCGSTKAEAEAEFVEGGYRAPDARPKVLVVV